MTSLAVPHTGPGGTRMMAERDVLGVCDALHEYDDRMYLEAGLPGSPAEGCFYVMMAMDDGRTEQLITWDTRVGGPLTAEIVHKLWEGDTWRPGNDPIKRWFEESARREQAEDAAFDERMTEDVVPRLLHALRTDGEADMWPLSTSPGFEVAATED